MSNKQDLHIETFAVGPLACNCTIVVDKSTKYAVLVDPGGDAEKLISRLEQLGANLKQIVITHGHFDHFLAASELKRATNADVCIHENDIRLYDGLLTQLKLFGIRMQAESAPKPDIYLKDEMEILNGGRILHTPGHSMGSVCVLFEDLSCVCSGDTLFHGSVGRTDLFGGSFLDLKDSICKKLYTLDDEIRVIPGHGAQTCIGDEKKTNPFVRQTMCACGDQTTCKSKM
eukprot:TRINITY_DN6392_c0_g1_i2.p1 TRINITY_DN6392_c0_g1~~TRINITY_DN6392_c0_g1_i2.p1  ORF type:complete len:230 (+),score=52.91 TRINITY_DN6392_c0_g1_i2:46-735(+)